MTKKNLPVKTPRPSHVMTPEKRAYFASLPKPQERQEVHELPAWVKIGLVRRVIGDLTYKEAAKTVNHAESSLAAYGQSPAAKKWLSYINEFISDPVALSKAVLAEKATDITLDRFIIFEAAKEAGNWDLADKIAKDLQDRMGIVAKRQDAGAISVKISLSGAHVDAEAIDAEYEILEEASKDE